MNALALNRRSALLLAAATGVSCAAGGAFASTAGVFTMPDFTRELCERYYRAWQHKDLDRILGCLHPDVTFKSPNAKTQGRDAYAAGAKRFFSLVERLEVRSTFTAADAAMAAVDFYCIQPIGICPTAERMALKDGLIIEDELFFDARPFEALARTKVARQGSK